MNDQIVATRRGTEGGRSVEIRRRHEAPRDLEGDAAALMDPDAADHPLTGERRVQ